MLPETGEKPGGKGNTSTGIFGALPYGCTDREITHVETVIPPLHIGG